MKNLYALIVAVSCVFAALVVDIARPSVAFAHPALATAAASIQVPVVVETVVVLPETTIVAQRPHRAPVAAKVWTCGSPRALAQGTGTVKECEYK